MIIYKASAGSGKTYRLSHYYIDLLKASKDRYAYRHLLAVTFTNKATAEMKAKILEELSKNEKLRPILIDILHDYSAFAVSTIERFFQQALKSFAIDIGRYASYQVELDSKSLIQEAADRLLDSISDNDPYVKDWIRYKMKDSLANGDKFAIDAALVETCRLIKSSRYRRLKEELQFDDAKAFSKSELAKLHKVCRQVISDFHTAVEQAAMDADKIMPEGRAKKTLQKHLTRHKYTDIIEDLQITLRKDDNCKALVDVFDNGWEDYNTAHIIDKNIYSLGLCGELLRHYNEILLEKNVLSLDDSGEILKGIIDNTDAPFIYEKLGVRYNTFLLDEFQDTSEIQWKNFLPLLRESESNNGGSLIVGDVKQSIYRFRDSDWTLLGQTVTDTFRNAKLETLDGNWRSLENIVEFNNDLFNKLSVDCNITSIYSALEQKVMCTDKDGQKGRVEVVFVDGSDKKGNEDAQVEEVIKCIKDACEKQGASLGDITILTRNGKEGALLADALIQKGIDVTSDDSLLIVNSRAIRLLLAILRCMDKAEDSISHFLVKESGIEIPKTYHSLPDMCELLLDQIREKDSQSFEGELVYINAFMDTLREWCENNGNQVGAFLQFWDEKDKRYVGAPNKRESVRIMTIHKSKGLQFPYVIVPFVEKIEFTGETDTIWAKLDCKQGPFAAFNGLYPVSFVQKLENSRFKDDYEEEKRQRIIDGANIAYVAFTRATKEMRIIAATPKDSKKQELRNVADILYSFTEQMNRWNRGEHFSFKQGKDCKDLKINASYPKIGMARRLRASEDALDYFGADGSSGSAASARIKGIVLHRILESVQRPEDLDQGVRAALSEGLLNPEQAQEAARMLAERIAAHPLWFNGGRNEGSVIDANGNEYRPDRVIQRDGETIIIDYKFGEESEKHIRQVGHYVELYRLMGYENVSGHVWYVPSDKVIDVL